MDFDDANQNINDNNDADNRNNPNQLNYEYTDITLLNPSFSVNEFIVEKEALNPAQKNIIEATIGIYIEEIQDRVKSYFEPLEGVAPLKPSQAIGIFEAMETPDFFAMDREIYEKLGVTEEDIEFFKKIYDHPYPQNRYSHDLNIEQTVPGYIRFQLERSKVKGETLFGDTELYNGQIIPYHDGETEWPNTVVVIEPTGLLSLTARDDMRGCNLNIAFSFPKEKKERGLYRESYLLVCNLPNPLLAQRIAENEKKIKDKNVEVNHISKQIEESTKQAEQAQTKRELAQTQLNLAIQKQQLEEMEKQFSATKTQIKLNQKYSAEAKEYTNKKEELLAEVVTINAENQLHYDIFFSGLEDEQRYDLYYINAQDEIEPVTLLSKKDFGNELCEIRATFTKLGFSLELSERQIYDLITSNGGHNRLTPPVTKEAVVAYIHTILQDAITEQELLLKDEKIIEAKKSELINSTETVKESTQNRDLKILVIQTPTQNREKMSNTKLIESYINDRCALKVHFTSEIDYLEKKINRTEELTVNVKLYPLNSREFESSPQGFFSPSAPEDAHSAIIAFDSSLANWETTVSSLISKIRSKLNVPIFLIGMIAGELDFYASEQEVMDCAMKEKCQKGYLTNLDVDFAIKDGMRDMVEMSIEDYLANENNLSSESNNISIIERPNL